MAGSRGGSTSTSSPSRRGPRPRAKKRFGQHFLTDANILRRIVDAAELNPRHTVVEVGAGRGSLTEVLAERAARVVAVEVDRDLIDGLRERFQARGNVKIIEADVLARPPGDVLQAAGGREPYVVVANLPYNVAAAVLRHFLEASVRPERLVVMVQREVADAIVALPGAMSLLSVAVQVYGEARMVMRVAPGAFSPPPRVQSAVVRIDVAPAPRVDEPMDVFFRVVRAGFSGPRKQLRNSLAMGLKAPQDAVERVLQVAGIDPKLRPQMLSIEDWAAITRAWRRESAR